MLDESAPKVRLIDATTKRRNAELPRLPSHLNLIESEAQFVILNKARWMVTSAGLVYAHARPLDGAHGDHQVQRVPALPLPHVQDEREARDPVDDGSLDQLCPRRPRAQQPRRRPLDKAGRGIRAIIRRIA